MAVYCGIDWAEGHHDIALVDAEGRLVGKRRIAESLDGLFEGDSGTRRGRAAPGRPKPEHSHRCLQESALH